MIGQWQHRLCDRPLFTSGGQAWTFVSDHEKEERILVLTEDYRDPRTGEFIYVEAIAWDGVESCPGIMIGPVRS